MDYTTKPCSLCHGRGVLNAPYKMPISAIEYGNLVSPLGNPPYIEHRWPCPACQNLVSKKQVEIFVYCYKTDSLRDVTDSLRDVIAENIARFIVTNNLVSVETTDDDDNGNTCLRAVVGLVSALDAGEIEEKMSRDRLDIMMGFIRKLHIAIGMAGNTSEYFSTQLTKEEVHHIIDTCLDTYTTMVYRKCKH